MQYSTFIHVLKTVVEAHSKGLRFFDGMITEDDLEAGDTFPAFIIVPVTGGITLSLQNNRKTFGIKCLLIDELPTDRSVADLEKLHFELDRVKDEIFVKLKEIGESEVVSRGEELSFSITDLAFTPLTDIGNSFLSGWEITATVNDDRQIDCNKIDRAFGDITFDAPYSVPPVCLPVTITDSDEVTTVEVPSGGSFECTPVPPCADAVITDSDGVSTFNVASGGTGACTVITPAPTNINYVPIPLTGQTVSYVADDDGDRFQNSDYIRTVNEGVTPLLTDFYTLDATTPNAFGNTNRFTNDLGNQVLDGSDTSTVGYFIDHYTGKGYVKSSSSMTRDNHITTAVSLVLGAYSGFNLTNMEEVDMIAPCNAVLSFPFNIVTPGAAKYHTSTTSSFNSANGKVLGQAWDLANIGHKTHSINAITGGLDAFYIRNHYTL